MVALACYQRFLEKMDAWDLAIYVSKVAAVGDSQILWDKMVRKNLWMQGMAMPGPAFSDRVRGAVKRAQENAAAILDGGGDAGKEEAYRKEVMVDGMTMAMRERIDAIQSEMGTQHVSSLSGSRVYYQTILSFLGDEHLDAFSRLLA